VAVNYLHGEQDARRVVEEIKTNGGQALAVHADVADRNQVEQMMEVICRELGPVDVLVNNAVRDYKPSSFLELTWEEIQKDLDVVVRGAFNCCQEALANMVERGGGSIINLSSQAVEIPPEGQTKYVIAKSGLVGLTRSLAVEFAPKNIRINLVAPSFVETDLTSYISPVSREEIRQETPLGRYAEPLEVAKTILFLASSMSSFITGQTIWMTGGLPPFR
jgi:3-oxoacyl-[acyl-carrier protein] reductase